VLQFCVALQAGWGTVGFCAIIKFTVVLALQNIFVATTLQFTLRLALSSLGF
jgi:hypothetical protein